MGVEPKIQVKTSNPQLSKCFIYSTSFLFLEIIQDLVVVE